jgi:FkbM family methyltransferase
MLIPLSSLVKKYNLTKKVKGIMHIGAHECEEKKDYDIYKFENVYWVEAMSLKVKLMKERYPDINIYHAVASDVDGKEVTLKIANNGQSSSILELGTHKEKHPEVHYIAEEKHLTKRMTTLIEEEKIDMDKVNFLNLDIQGNELRALKGMEEYLNKVDYIYSEVNVDYLYVDCCLMKEIDEYLKEFGFKRVVTKMCGDTGWGDAFYVKDL